MKKIYLLSLLMLLPLVASADPVLINGIYYNLNSSDQTAEVTQQDLISGGYYSGEVIIPETVTHENVIYNVTSVGMWAFRFCNRLTSVTIPNSVISIGIQAFDQCGITSVIIGSNVTTIASDAFQQCRNLTSLTIPKSVTSMEDNVFHGCSALTSIVVEEGNAYYDSRGDCNAIIETATNTLVSGCNNTVIPSGVTSIGIWAFRDCSGLTSLSIPNSVTSIGDYAFSYCSGLTTLSIGSGLATIGENAFFACGGLTSIVVDEGNTTYDSRNNCNALIEKASNTLLLGCKNTTIPNNVTTIGDGAFSGCGLTSLAIPSSVTTIGNSAFNGCSSLTSISIGNGVTSIGSGAFAGCSNVTTIVVDDNNTAYDSRNNCNAIIEKSTNTLIAGCNNSTIPDGVTVIGDGAFYDCTGLTSLSIPNSVISIGTNAFAWSGLTSVTFSENLTTIGKMAFEFCHGLTSVTIPNSVVTIGQQAFYQCENLTSATLGSGVNEVGWLAFGGFKNFTNLYCYAEAVPKADETKGSPYMAFDRSINKATLHVPASSVDAYKATEPWSGFGEIVGVPQHSLVYKVDGEVYKSYQICEGASITPEAEPTKEGYDFSGWSTIPATMPAEDLTITGTFWLATDVDEIVIKDIGKTTWCSEYDLDFTNVQGIKAYTATGYNDITKTIWLTRVLEVPAGTGLLVKGDAGTYKIPHVNVRAYYTNMLVGNLGETIKIEETDGDKTNYYLSGKDGTFVSVSGNANIGKNKAYLQLPTSIFAGTRTIGVSFDDEDGTTAIRETKQSREDGAYYTLQGQRVVNPGKGLYIHNGKKIVIK